MKGERRCQTVEGVGRMNSRKKFAALTYAVLAGGALAAVLPGASRAEQGEVLDEIIVTAQKKNQSVLDVGMSVNAMGGEELTSAGITDPSELNGFVPSLNVKNNIPGASPIFTIRGVGLNNFAANNNPTVGVYIDEVFLASTAMMSFSLYDIDRVEVLKGPQGTLYGRNTTAGAIGFFTKKPEHEFDADVSVTYGNFEHFEAEGSLNIPLGETLAMRVSGQAIQQSKGYWTDLQGKTLGNQSVRSGRLQLAFEPSHDLKADLKFEYTDVDSQAGQFEMFGTQDPQNPFAKCAPVLQGRVDRSQCADFFGNMNNTGDVFRGDWHPQPYLMRQSGVALSVKANLGDLELDSISGYEYLDRTLGTDVDGTHLRQADFLLKDKIRQYSQEFRLSGDFHKSLHWILGTFYSQDTVDSEVDGDFSDLVALLTGGLVNDERSLNLIHQNTKTWAAFAHTEWAFSDEFSLTTAARYTDEKKAFVATATDLSLLAGTGGGFFGLPDPNCGAGQVACNSVPGLHETNVSWRTGLDYKPTKDLLAYASVSKGYKSGGINGGFVTQSAVLEPFKPEELLAYEIGAKADLLGGAMRVTGAAFYYDYTDVQTQVHVDVGQLSVIRIGNVHKAKIRGTELELRWLPIHGLDLSTGLSYLNSELGAFDSPVGPVGAGNKLPNAPEVSLVSAASYTVPIGDYSVVLGANARYTDAVYRDALNQRLLASGTEWLFDANLDLVSKSSHWKVSLWGKNLSNEQVVQVATDNGIGDGYTLTQQPRTYGATVKYKFK
jgi:iron complex outermembrane recepter protein